MEGEGGMTKTRGTMRQIIITVDKWLSYTCTVANASRLLLQDKYKSLTRALSSSHLHSLSSPFPTPRSRSSPPTQELPYTKMLVSNINRPFTMVAAVFLAIIVLSTSFTNATPVPESLVDSALKTVGKNGAATVAPILPLNLDKGALDADRKVQTGAAPLYDNNNLLGQIGGVLGTVESTVGPDSLRAGAVEGARNPLACSKPVYLLPSSLPLSS